MTEEARMAMPSYSGTQRLIERQREVPGKSLVDTKNLVDIEINVNLVSQLNSGLFQGIFATDHNNDRFLLYDSRVTEPENVVFFIFCTDEGLRRLRTYRNWAADGTFKSFLYKNIRFFIYLYLSCSVEYAPAVYY